jgi:sodium-dependent dicarboxylate transporter 2/3/5
MLRFTNDSRFIILIIILSTALMSAIIANTTAAAIMLPIGLSIIKSLPKKNRKKFAICILLSIAYSASIGGTISLIGTTPNLFAAQFLAKGGIIISFSDWLKLISPFSFIMLFSLWLFMLFKFGILKSQKINIKIEKIPNETGAKIVSLIIIITVIVWTIKPFVPILHDIDDVMIGLISSVLLIIIPIPGKKILLGWKDIKIPWGILLLFGGGLALGNSLLVSGTAQYIVEFLPEWNNFILIIFVIASLSVMLTEFMSNTAFSATFIPLFLLFANSLGINPLFVVLTVAVCSSLAFMLPIGTPPNTIVYKTKYVKIFDMIKTGILLNVISIILWTLYVFLVV